MKILMLTTHLDIGGIGVYTVSLAIALKRAGFSVGVASSGGLLAGDLEKAGIEHIKIPVNTSSDIGLHTFVSASRITDFVKQRGITIVHAQTRVTQVIASLIARKTKISFISTCHGFFKMKLFRKMFPCWGDHTIAISDAVRQHLVCDFKVAKDSVSIIYNGIDTDKFSPKASPADKGLIRKQYSLGNGPVIGIISRLSKVKGHKYLLNAFKDVLQKIPDAQLFIVGDGPSKYKNALVSQAGMLGISSQCRIVPACKDTSVPLSVIDVFCHPSLQEGLGLSILEAMAMQIPVVASDVGGIYTLIKHRVNGLLTPVGDEKAIFDAIIEILHDQDMAYNMGLRSREKVIENFTIDIMRDKVIEVYKRMK